MVRCSPSRSGTAGVQPISSRMRAMSDDEVAGLDLRRHRGPFDVLHAPTAASSIIVSAMSIIRVPLPRPDVVDTAVAGRRRGQAHERADEIVHVDVVAPLRSVAVDRQRVVVERQMNQSVHHTIRRAARRLPGTVWIGDARNRVAQAEQRGVEPQVALDGGLVDGVKTQRIRTHAPRPPAAWSVVRTADASPRTPASRRG